MQRRQFISCLSGLALSSPVLARTATRTAEALFDLTRGAHIYPSERIDFFAQPYVEYAPR